jgi:hypothetical protein
MTLISNGIDCVRAMELPCGIWAEGSYVGTPRTALVKWRSSLSDVLYQIYVSDQYAGATIDEQQREMIVPLPTCPQSAVRIEVFAVQPELAHIDFSNEIKQPPVDSGRVRISLLRSQDLPIGATAMVYFDGGTGEIDYQMPLGDLPIRIWPCWQDKAGFGMSKFGASDFGYDSAAAVGFGKGSFGNGQFGLDADTIEWVSPVLAAGEYRFAVKIFDDRGNASSGSETGPITVTPAARPAEKLSISSFDKQMNLVVLNMEDSG